MSIASVRTLEDLRVQVTAWKQDGLKVGFVPTMGALHEGHLSLVDIALEHADCIVASIFVNPKQFAPHEDFDAYPRDEADDMAKLESRGTHLVYLPSKDLMYPEDYATHFTLSGPALELETDIRPHFFNGIAAVVTKLFNQVRPDIAVFGEKDYQQLCMIKQLVKDLDMDVEVIGGPLVRDENGLALSSRNAYLSEDQYETACKLNKILFGLAEKLKASPDKTVALLEQGKADILAAGFDKVDYLELRAEDTLKALDKANAPARLLTAAHLGKTRLLDNVEI